MIKISIIIPVYNVENYIEKCFESIIRQKNMYEAEIICIDDGSTDSSGIICDQYAEKDKRFKVIHQKNSGVSTARNVGLEMARGEYIAWIDPDDCMNENWYTKIKPFIEKKVDVIFFDYISIVNDNEIKVKYEDKSKYMKRGEFLKELVLNTKIQSHLWSKVIKRTLFSDIKFPVDLRELEDFAVIHYIIEKAEKIYYISDYLYYYLVRETGLVRSEIDFDFNYKGYLLSKDRYKYLIERNVNVSRIGYMLYASCVCMNFYKLKIFNEEQLIKFKTCKKELNNNIKYILLSKEAPRTLKIKAIGCKLGILRILSKIKNMRKK